MGNRRIHRTWVLKDKLEQFWDFKSRQDAEDFLKKWMTTALKSRLEPIKNFVKTLRTYLHWILPYIEGRLTNAVAEGLNRLIKIVKNSASGFKTFSTFEDMIFLVVGDLNLPGQIPTKFRRI